MYLKQSLKDVADKNSVFEQSNLITCGRCENNFVFAKIGSPRFCPHCGKELGLEVIYKRNTVACSG
jgi:uncharacterized CHY-type Zn-finger protein